MRRYKQHLQCQCLPKDILGEGHSLHEGHRCQVHSVCHIAHSIDAGYGCLIEAIHLDLPLGAQIHTNLQHSADQAENEGRGGRMGGGGVGGGMGAEHKDDRHFSKLMCCCAHQMQNAMAPKNKATLLFCTAIKQKRMAER